MSHNLKINGVEYPSVDKITVPDVNGKDVEFVLSDGYIDKSKVTHFATGVVNITAGKVTVSGIADEKTGEAFTPKGIYAVACPSETMYYKSANGQPAAMAIYCNFATGESSCAAIYSIAYQGRLHHTAARDRLSVNGNSFTYQESQTSMYGLVNTRWRWFAWG